MFLMMNLLVLKKSLPQRMQAECESDIESRKDILNEVDVREKN